MEVVDVAVKRAKRLKRATALVAGLLERGEADLHEVARVVYGVGTPQVRTRVKKRCRRLVEYARLKGALKDTGKSRKGRFS